MNPGDVRKLANRYLSCLQQCFPQSPTSHNAARTVHAHMITSGFKPHGLILNRLIDIYSKSSNLTYARQLFDQYPEPDVFARTTMISAYSSSGNVKMAKEVFNGIPMRMRDTVCYNALITCYSHNHDGHAALNLFLQMRRDGFRPDNFTFTSVLAALGLIADDEKHCQQMHCAVVKSGTGFVTSVLNALLTAYVKCAVSPLVSVKSVMGAARKLFDEILVRDELSWTTMITGYVKVGDLDAALELLNCMDQRLPVAWNAMISGYVHHGFVQEAMEMFRKMHLLGLQLDEFTYTSIVSACADLRLFRHGKELHAYILKTEAKPKSDFLLSVNNALITFYSNCGKIVQAREIFNRMPLKDLVSWNAILSGYVNAARLDEAREIFEEMPERNLLTWTVMISNLAENGFGEEALKLFNQMRFAGLEPCDYAYAGAIKACAVLGALMQGFQLHSQVIRLGHDSSLSVGNSLITMYARCGAIEAANCVFLTMPYLDSVSWNAMIAALGQHGQGLKAIELFEEMLKEGICPDRITFLTILSACSHAGLVTQGRRYFDLMYSSYGIIPGGDHYARLVDLFSRSGKFSEAVDVINSMPCEPGSPIWEALLSGCRLHENMDLGIEVAGRLLELKPQNDGTYILLSSMYADAGRWDDVAKVRTLMRDHGVKKEPGCSWVEIEKKVHVFLVADARHPEVQSIYRYLKELVEEMRKLGYIPDTKFVLHDVESGQKEASLLTHSEKLAAAYGLMKLPREATIRIFKNLRICGDCHNAFKYMTKVVGREIVVRDGKRFHHFRDGCCSCGDFW